MDTLQLSLCYIAIKTAHIDEMVAFYTEVIGLHVLNYENEVVFLGTVKERQPILMLIDDVDHDAKTEHHLDHFAFQIQSLDAFYALLHRLNQAKIKYTTPSQQGSLIHFFCEDYDHNQVEFYYQGEHNIEMILNHPAQPAVIEHDPVSMDKLQDVTLGHIHLSVPLLEETLMFYRDILSVTILDDEEDRHHTTDENKETLLMTFDKKHETGVSPIDFIVFQLPELQQLFELKERLEHYHYDFYFNLGKQIIQLWDANHISYWFQVAK